MCSKDLLISGSTITKLDESYFHTEEAREVYQHISAFFTKKGQPPNFKLLCEDGKLSEDSREFLRSANTAAKTKGQVEQLVAQLNQYRQTRLYYQLAKKLLRRLEEPKIDPDQMSDLVSEAISRIQLRKGSEADIIHIGRDSNVRAALEDLLYSEERDDCIPTGFTTFDSVNGGFFRGSLCVIAGSSGGGKSILANQLNLNQSALGYKTSLTPLEMSSPEMLARSAAALSGMSSLDIFLRRMATGERDHVWKKFTRFDKKVAKAGGRYTIFKPKEDLSIEELMAALHTFNADVVYIDYINLLKGADGDEQWKKLGQIARFGKVYAESSNKVMVLLAQLSEEGRIRYSQAIKEHASLCWAFTATKETKERGYMNIELLKSRNQSDKPFTLKIDYAHMRVSDLTPDEMKRIDPKKPQGKDGKGGKSSSKDGSSEDYTPQDLSE